MLNGRSQGPNLGPYLWVKVSPMLVGQSRGRDHGPSQCGAGGAGRLEIRTGPQALLGGGHGGACPW